MDESKQPADSSSGAGSSGATDDERLKWALEHARGLFIYHAGQRIASVNYYFLAIAVVITGFAHIATSSDITPGDRALLGIGLAVAGAFLTHFFKTLDLRNMDLVDCDSELLMKVEGLMKDDGIHEWTVTRAAKDKGPASRHYRVVVPKIFGLYLWTSILGGCYSAWPWLVEMYRLVSQGQG